MRKAGADEVSRAVIEHAEEEPDHRRCEDLEQRRPERLGGKVDKVKQPEQ